MTSALRGVAIGIWGAIAYLPTLGIFTDPWIVWINCLIWAVVYTRTTPTLKLAVVQALATMIAAAGGAFLAEATTYALLAVFPALLYFAVWMAPVGLVKSFLKKDRTK